MFHSIAFILSDAQLSHLWLVGVPLFWLLDPFDMILVVSDSFPGAPGWQDTKAHSHAHRTHAQAPVGSQRFPHLHATLTCTLI